MRLSVVVVVVETVVAADDATVEDWVESCPKTLDVVVAVAVVVVGSPRIPSAS